MQKKLMMPTTQAVDEKVLNAVREGKRIQTLSENEIH